MLFLITVVDPRFAATNLKRVPAALLVTRGDSEEPTVMSVHWRRLLAPLLACALFCETPGGVQGSGDARGGANAPRGGHGNGNGAKPKLKLPPGVGRPPKDGRYNYILPDYNMSWRQDDGEEVRESAELIETQVRHSLLSKPSFTSVISASSFIIAHRRAPLER